MKRITLTLLCLLFASCDSLFKEEEHWQIGRFKIYQSDVDARSKIVQIFYPQNKIAEAGFIQLKNAYVTAAVLENNGHIINEHKLINESSRIDASSRDPKTLNKIKDIFRKNGKLDKEAYFRTFILPSYAERALPSVFQELPLHAETLKKAQDFYAKVRANPEKLMEMAKEEKLSAEYLCISEAEGFTFSKTDPEKKKSKKDKEKGPGLVDLSKVANQELRDSIMSTMTNSSGDLVRKWFTDIVVPTKPGQVVSRIVDYYSSWMVLRLRTKNEKRACFEAAMVSKETLESWLEKEKAKVSVRHVK